MIRITACFTAMLVAGAATQDSPTVQQLIDRLGDEEPKVRNAAQEALLKLGEKILDQLKAALTTSDPEVRRRLENILKELCRWERIVWADERAVDVDEGKIVWKLPYAERSPLSVSRMLGRDVIVTLQDGKVQRRSITDGKVLWEAEGFGEYSQVVFAEDRAVQLVRTNLRAVDLATGKELWKADCGDRPEHKTDRLGVLGAHVFVVGENESSLFDLSSGKKLWSVSGKGSRAALLPTGDVIVAFDKCVKRLRATDGRELWRIDLSEARWCEVVAQGDQVIVGTDRWMRKSFTDWIDAETGKSLVHLAGYPLAIEGPFAEKCWFIATSERLCAVNAKLGKMVWEQAIHKEGIQVKAEGDRLFLCEYEPISCGVSLRCLKPATGEQLWKADAKGVQVSHSKYLHEVTLVSRPDTVVLIGEASGGDYVEAFRKSDGKTISRWSTRK